MFGHDDNQQTQNQENTTTVQPTVSEPATDMAGFTPPPADPPAPDDSTAEPVSTAALDVSIDSALELPGSSGLPGNLTASEPITDESAAPEPATTAPTPALTTDEDTDNDTPAPSGELIDLKQEALQSLSPLVEKLDQTPEERFRTTMMMIQATDDSSKIRAAYEAAQKIEDEKVRAQALLDVVNEINYFTQQEQKEK